MAETRGQGQPQQREKQGSEPAAKAEPRPASIERGPERGIEPSRRSPAIMRPEGASYPFSMMGRFMGDIGRLFEDFGFGRDFAAPLIPRGENVLGRATWTPQVDVFERDGNLVVHADLPGLRQEDVNVSIDDGLLTLSGERTLTEEHEKGGVYHRERSYGSFQRSLALPDGIDPERVQATFDNGVLVVTMPLPPQQARKGRAIPIRSSSGSPQTKH